MRKWIASLVLVTAVHAVSAGQQSFGDPDRRAKLATAFADIDRLFAEYAKTAHLPGARGGS